MNLLHREQRSLFGEILDWMLTPLLLLWPVSLVLTWLVAQSIAGKPFDRALEYNARAMAQLIIVHNNRAEFNLPRPARELLRANDSDTVYYQVLGSRHELLSGERDLPAPPTEETVTRDEVHIRDDVIKGFDVKVAYIWVSLPIQDARPALVQVAE